MILHRAPVCPAFAYFPLSDFIWNIFCIQIPELFIITESVTGFFHRHCLPEETREFFMEPAFVNLEKGVIELFNRAYERAIVHFDKQISLTPETPEAYLYRGHTRFILNDITGACDDWRKALSLGSSVAARYTGKYCK